MINQLYERNFILSLFETIWVNKENIKLANKKKNILYFKAIKMGP